MSYRDPEKQISAWDFSLQKEWVVPFLSVGSLTLRFVKPFNPGGKEKSKPYILLTKEKYLIAELIYKMHACQTQDQEAWSGQTRNSALLMKFPKQQNKRTFFPGLWFSLSVVQ